MGHGKLADLIFSALARETMASAAGNIRATTAEMMRFDSAYHENLERDDPITKLQPIRWLLEPASTRNTVMIAMDQGYLETYYEILLRNLALNDRPSVHIHVIDPVDDKTLIALAEQHNCALTVECPGLSLVGAGHSAAYYSSIRFCRAYQFLREDRYERIVTVDLDAVWRPGIGQVVADPRWAGFAICNNKTSVPWSRFSAGTVSADRSATALAWLGTAARQMADILLSGGAVWRLDQCAFYSAWYRMAKSGNDPLFVDLLPIQGQVAYHTQHLEHGVGGSIPGVTDTEFDGGKNEALGKSLMASFNFDLAAEQFEQTLAAGGATDETRYLLGQCRYRLGLWDDAEQVALDISDGARAAPLLDRIRVARFHEDLEQKYVFNTVKDPKKTADFGAVSSALSQLAGAFSRNSVTLSPYTYSVMKDIFPESAYGAFLRSLPPDDSLAAEHRYGSNNSTFVSAGDPELDDALADLLAIAERREFISLMVDHLGARSLWEEAEARGFELVATAGLAVHRNNYALGPHRDDPSRFATLILYFPQDEGHRELGTRIYRPLGGMRSGDHGKRYALDGFTEVDIAPYAPNCGFAFLNFGDAYHGVAKIEVPTLRRAVFFNVVLRTSESALLD